MKNILIVDIDHQLYNIVSSYLALINIKAHFASRVREAIQKTHLQKYDAIVIEPNMDREQGEEIVFDLMQKGHLNGATPVVYWTKDLAYIVSESASEHITAILKKPFNFKQLQTTLLNLNPQPVSV